MTTQYPLTLSAGGTFIFAAGHVRHLAGPAPMQVKQLESQSSHTPSASLNLLGSAHASTQTPGTPNSRGSLKKLSGQVKQSSLVGLEQVAHAGLQSLQFQLSSGSAY